MTSRATPVLTHDRLLDPNGKSSKWQPDTSMSTCSCVSSTHWPPSLCWQGHGHALACNLLLLHEGPREEELLDRGEVSPWWWPEGNPICWCLIFPQPYHGPQWRPFLHGPSSTSGGLFMRSDKAHVNSIDLVSDRASILDENTTYTTIFTIRSMENHLYTRENLHLWV